MQFAAVPFSLSPPLPLPLSIIHLYHCLCIIFYLLSLSPLLFLPSLFFPFPVPPLSLPPSLPPSHYFQYIVVHYLRSSGWSISSPSWCRDCVITGGYAHQLFFVPMVAVHMKGILLLLIVLSHTTHSLVHSLTHSLLFIFNTYTYMYMCNF